MAALYREISMGLAAEDNPTKPTLQKVELYPSTDVFGSSEGAPEPRGGVNNRKLIVVFADISAVIIGLWISVVLNGWINPSDPTSAGVYIALLGATMPVWPLAFTHQALYKARFITRGIDEGWRGIKAVFLAVVAIGIASIAFDVEIGRTWYAIAIPSLLVVVGIERIIARLVFKRARSNGKLLRRVLIVGKNSEGWLVKDMLDRDKGLGYEVVGFVEDKLAMIEGREVTDTELLRNVGETLAAVEEADCGGVIISATAMDIGTSNRLIRTLTENGVHVELSSTLCDIASDRLTIRPLGRVPMVYIEPVQRHGWRAVAKRAFDMVTAAILVVVFSPLMAAAALAVRLTSPGPIFFAQERVGRDGQLFKVLKFRTMVTNAEELLENVRHLNEATGPLFKIKDDPRITKAGKFLRKTSIDELPQLFNVIRGEMSLVGPRPALPSERDQWDPSLLNRLRVQPGITGMWQVNGRSDAEDGDYGQLDLYYVDNWTLATDILILLRTVPAVLLQKGAH